MIKDMKQKGMNITQIANELGRDRKTIRHWLKEDAPRSYSRAKKHGSKLDPHKDYIRGRMEEGCLNGAVILDEIRARGYTGGATLLRDFMRPLRPCIREKATIRFETPAGEQAQVDWGRVNVNWSGQTKRLYIFVMVLCYSRMLYVEFTEDEKLETLMGCHLRAMQYFGGITRTVLYDNMKTVVTGQDENGEVIWNERFAAFAAHHGFILKRCRPYRARTKGKVENGVKYVKQNFWPRVREFQNLHDLNLQARRWMDSVANVRVHGTTHEIPLERWRQEGLKRFNFVPFETVERHRRKVSNDSLISYEANRYSVPFKWVGQTVSVQDDKNGRIRIYAGEEPIAEHVKSGGRHQVIFNTEHVRGLQRHDTSRLTEYQPNLVSSPAPEVSERSLEDYDLFAEEAMLPS